MNSNIQKLCQQFLRSNYQHIEWYYIFDCFNESQFRSSQCINSDQDDYNHINTNQSKSKKRNKMKKDRWQSSRNTLMIIKNLLMLLKKTNRWIIKFQWIKIISEFIPYLSIDQIIDVIQ
ncbi:hypothetical protein pb186bvf_014263 [Paramecium bursaria]